MVASPKGLHAKALRHRKNVVYPAAVDPAAVDPAAVDPAAVADPLTGSLPLSERDP